jgi:hypothetical protein
MNSTTSQSSMASRASRATQRSMGGSPIRQRLISKSVTSSANQLSTYTATPFRAEQLSKDRAPSIASQLGNQVVQRGAVPVDVARKTTSIGRMLEERQASFQKKNLQGGESATQVSSGTSNQASVQSITAANRPTLNISGKRAATPLTGAQSSSVLTGSRSRSPSVRSISNANTPTNLTKVKSSPTIAISPGHYSTPPSPGSSRASVSPSMSSNRSLMANYPMRGPDIFSQELSKRSITCGLMSWRDFEGLGSDLDLSSKSTSFYCILFTDNVKFAKTQVATSESKSWSEEFILDYIPQCHENLRIMIFVSSANGASYQKIGYVSLSYSDLKKGIKTEDWHPVIPMDGRQLGAVAIPSVRIAYTYSTYQKLSKNVEDQFLELVIETDFTLVKLMDQFVGVRREEFSKAFVNVLISQQRETEGILSLLRHEVEKATNHKVLFRGSSITTKTMDQYMKLVGSDYLYTTLHAIVEHLYSLTEGCEVDPNKLSSKKEEEKEKILKKNAKSLLDNVEAVTYAIFNSVDKFPP